MKDDKIVIYVGDSGNIIKRILTNHCSGNVEASALRKYVAIEKGYKIKKTKRSGGSTRVRIDLPDPRVGEVNVSDYLRSGYWKYIICDSPAEANDFQNYVIEQLKPILNRICKPWNHGNLPRYVSLLNKLISSSALNYEQLHSMESGPGVYVFYHQVKPSKMGS